MGFNVNSFKLLSEFIANKTQSGGTVSVSQFEAAANSAQLQVFEKDRLTFLKTGESSDYLDWFLKSTTLNPSTLTGYANYPNDFQHTSAVRAYYNKKERPVELVTTQAWGDVNVSELYPATGLFPKYCEFSGEFRFAPKNIGIVMLDYWKTPVKPVWGFTVANNRQVYNPATSTDFEWPDFALNSIMGNYLALIGVNLKDKDLQQFSEAFKQQNNTIV